MGAKKRAKSHEDELQSCEGLEGQGNHLQLPNLSHGSIADDVSQQSKRTNAADKTYWTRVFTIDDPVNHMLELDELKPGIYCFNVDLKQNQELIKDKEEENEKVAVPLFEPKSFTLLYDNVLWVKDFTLSPGELQTYGEMATSIRQVMVAQALEQEQAYKIRYPNCPID